MSECEIAEFYNSAVCSPASSGEKGRLAMPTCKASPEQIATLEAKFGRGTPVKLPQATPEAKDDAEPKLCLSTFLAHDKHIEFNIPVATASEVNQRSWKARSRRTGAAWKAVSKSLAARLSWLAVYAEGYCKHEPIYVRFTRLGGRRLDRSNLPTAVKAVEDAVAFMLGADDGDPRWHPSFEQIPGGLCGVRVEISCWPLPEKS